MAVLSLALVLAPSGLRAQQQGNVLLEPSEQLFYVLAALNAAGYDTGAGSNLPDNTRSEIRAYLAKSHAPVIAEIEKFYTEHRVAGDPGTDFGQFVSLALLLGPPPEFRTTVAATDLPPDAKMVSGLIPLVKTLYNEANLLNLWTRVQPRYRAAVERYSEDVRKSVVLTDAYFRFPAGGYLGRTYTIYLDLLGVPEQVQARIYGSNYFLVVTQSKEPKLSEIRHQYLHFLLDPLASKYALEIHQKADLRTIAYQAPRLPTDFKEDFSLLVTECVIRAAELRMDKRPKAEAERTLEELTSSGFILTRYFYEALDKFEQQEASMNVYYKQMILGIDLKAEQRRLASVKYPPKEVAAAQEAAPARSEEERLLDDGDNYFFRGRYNDAKTAFQAVLQKYDPKSERALFGMAVVWSNTRKPDLAEEYFQKTLDAARDLRISTWSHIYLGRLYDIKGERDKAVAQYRAASLTAAAFPEAYRAAQNGLARAFGSKD